MDKVIEAVRQLLSSAVANPSSPLYFNAASPSSTPNGIRAVYWGDPVRIPESNCPALIVHPNTTRPTRRGTRYDQKVHGFDARLVYNAKQYLGQQGTDPNKVFSLEDAIKKTEQVDIAFRTGSLTIVGIVQSNPTLPYVSVPAGFPPNASQDAQWLSTSYVFNSNRGFPTFEVVSTFEATVVGDRA